jgi:DMSO/TMAO reductase YedYZ heme-binding membrane subunit
MIIVHVLSFFIAGLSANYLRAKFVSSKARNGLIAGFIFFVLLSLFNIVRELNTTVIDCSVFMS